MSNKHILDLTLRLSQALDQNYDVVSMETVLSVITALEGATITKEQLEATRLAKYINQLRRRTKSDNLARRAKSLLKKWREMVGIQQTNESTTPLVGSSLCATASSMSMLSATVPSDIPVTDNAVSISNLAMVPQLRTHHSDTQHQYRAQHHNSTKQQHQQNHQPCHSQPTSPLSYMEKSNQNEFLNSTMSNPASVPLPNKSGGNLAVRKKKSLEKLVYDQQQQQPAQQQPTSFANLLTGLGSSSTSFSSLRKSREIKSSSISTIAKPPMETFIIEHSSNSNSDLICIPSNTVRTFTSSKNVPPIVIDLQDTNSSMNSLVSKDVTNASLTFSSLTTATTKPSTKKSKKDKKRKERDILHQNQRLHDCDDNNTTTNISYHNLQRPPDKLLMEEKSHSACPTISNISEILSLSNSSMSSVFPSTDATSKNIYESGQNEFSSTLNMSKSDLTFAGKFKQNTSSTTSALCDVLNYNSDSVSGVNVTSSHRSTSPSNRNKFTPFSGIGIATNSSDSTSSSHVSQMNVVDAIKKYASNYGKQNVEELPLKHDSNDKSLSNMSNKGNFSIDNVFVVAAPSPAITSQQQLQSIDLTSIDLSSEQTIKQPKKRGRKKGSKGVDSVIAKETSLSSQMLISSLTAGGKKVKTTKELYAEMQNRKLHSASNIVGPGGRDISTQSSSINWKLQQQQKTFTLQRISSCSDIAESDSCTMTSELSRDSANLKMGKNETPLDSNSNYSQFDTDLKTYDVQQKYGILPAALNSSAIALTTAIIKNQVNEILKQLATPPTIRDLELESLSDSIPCTCSVIEILPKTEHNNDNSDDVQVNNRHTDDSSTSFVCATTKNETIKDEKKLNENENIKNILNVDTSIANIQKNTLQLPPSKKSIFDLDFDDDEDPLNSIIADIVGKNSKKNDLDAVNSAKVDDDSVTNAIYLMKSKDEPTIDGQQMLLSSLNININLYSSPPQPVASDIQIVFPTYDVKLDPNCKARQRFDLQTQKITKFHIDALHNCFIPNINGNWNHAQHVVTNDNVSLNTVNDNKDVIIDGYGVVPFYGTENNDHIKKDLSHVKFTKKIKSKRSCKKNEVFYNIPFMGVARVIQDSTKSSGRSKKIKAPRRYNEDYEKKGENIILKSHQEDYSNIAQVKKKKNEIHKVFDDLYNNSEQPSNINNNNNVILKKIFIDIKSDQIEEGESAMLTPNYNTTSLLAIADVNNFTKTDIEPKIEIYGNEEKEVLEEQELQNSSHNDDNCRRNSSSSSNNSSKQSQQSITLKLKQQRREKQHQESLELKKRAKLKRLKFTKQPLIKRLKVHINGNIESVPLNQRFSDENENHNSYANISDFEELDFREKYNDDDDEEDNGYDENEEDEENKYNDDADNDGGDNHHEVVPHDISDSPASGRKHIVLTIKKTPSKTNSPINFLSNLSPSSSSPLKNINVNSLENNNCNKQLDNQNHINERNENIPKQIQEEYTRLNCFKKRLEHTRQISPKKVKLRNVLFFPDELCPLIRKHAGQMQESILNTSSCSSSTCTDNEEYDELETDRGEMLSYQSSFQGNNEALSTITSSSKSSHLSGTNVEKSQKVESNNDLTIDENIEHVINDDSDNDNYLPEENNLMLLTFNNIYCKDFKKENNLTSVNRQHQQDNIYPDEDVQLQNCDDYNNLYNNSNLNLIKYIDNKSSFVNNNNINSCSNNYSQHNNNIISSSSRSSGNCNSLITQDENNEEIENIVSNQIQPYKEYHTGIRAVDEDVNDAQGNNCARLQQFKEWHEVLQLRSYNDELLTVLPYVVLE